MATQDYSFHFNSQVRLNGAYGVMYFDSEGAGAEALANKLNGEGGQTGQATSGNAFLPNWAKFDCAERVISHDKNSLPATNMKDMKVGRITLYNAVDPTKRKTFKVPLAYGFGATKSDKDLEWGQRLMELGAIYALAGLTDEDGNALDSLMIPGVSPYVRDVTQQDSSDTSKTP